ncbi:MAG TPA: TonB-dependent receptor [Myxococcota bacterium]|nr:TonB-dependent receptor [Myxococcota bacterium]
MRKVLPVVLACCGLLLAPGQVRAQDEDDEGLEDEFALLEEDETVYSAAKHEQKISDSPSTVTVITREQIENTHCTNITCLLRQVPEIEVRRMKPMHHSVGARALASEIGDKVLLLVDGREDNVEAFGMPFWCAMAVHLEDIERIEVIRGPGSALYGANAHSLVVNVTTRSEDRNSARIFLGAGQHGRASLDLAVNRVIGAWSLRLNAGREAADSFDVRDSSKREVDWVGLRVARDWGSSTSRVDLSYMDGSGSVSISLSPAELQDLKTIRAMVSHESDWLRAHVWYQMFRFEMTFDMPLQYGDTKLGTVPSSMYMLNQALDTDLQINQELFAGNLLIGGVDYRFLSMFMDGNDPETVFQHRLGAFIQDEQRLWDRLSLLAGLRLDYNSITPLTLSPRAAIVCRAGETQALRLAFGRAFRKPSFFNTSVHLTNVLPASGFPEVTDFMRRSIGNEDLGNEEVTSLEVGYRGRFLDGDLTIESDAFFNWYRDMIAFTYNIVEGALGVPDLYQSWFRFENNGLSVNSAGGSVSLVYTRHKALRLSANYTYRYSWYVNETFTDLYGKGDRVPWEPAHLFNVACSYFFQSGLRLGAAVHLRSGFREPWAADGGLFGKQILVAEPVKAMLGAYVSYRLGVGDGWVEAGVRALDLLNASWRDLTGVTRFDGVPVGGQTLGRLMLLFVRGEI